MSANQAHRFSSRLLPVRTGCAQELRVTPEDPVFTHTRGGPIELNSLLPHWYAAQRANGIRVRGLYSTKDTFVSTALQAG